MKMRKITGCLTGLAAVLVLAGHGLGAPILYVDFGDTVYGGTDGGPAGISGSWTHYPDNTDDLTVGGITIDDGNGGSPSVNWGNDGQDDSTGTFSGAMGVAGLYNDWMQSGNGGNVFGIRVNGLSPGIYYVYLVPGEDTSTDGTLITLGLGDASTDQRSEIVSAAVTADRADFSESLADWTPSGTDTPYNYMVTTVTISSSTDDYIVAIGDSGNKWGFAALQIVEIPEPTSLMLLGLGGLALMRRRTSRG